MAMVRGTGRWHWHIPCETHRIDPQNQFPISSVAPNYVAIERPQLASNQLWTLRTKMVSVGESHERLLRRCDGDQRLDDPNRETLDKPTKKAQVYLLFWCIAQSKEGDGEPNRFVSGVH